MSMFPQNDFAPTVYTPANSTNYLKPLKEYAWDFDKNQFILQDGKFQIVEGKEAIKIWIWKALHTQRYRYMAYSWDYGHELEELIGKGYSEGLTRSETERYLNEALLVSPYIKSIEDVTVVVHDSSINVKFTSNTVYGEVITNV